MDYISSRRIIRHEDVLEYEDQGLSDSQIALRFGISKMGFLNIRRSMDWKRVHDWTRVDKGIARKSADEIRDNRNKYMRGYNRSNGIKYNRTRIGKVVYPTSRLVAKKYLLGRDFKEGEVVHHIDGVSTNDSPENLLVFASNADHLAYHRGEKVDIVAEYRGVCFFCGFPVTLESFCLEGNGKNVCNDCAVEHFEDQELVEEDKKKIWREQ